MPYATTIATMRTIEDVYRFAVAASDIEADAAVSAHQGQRAVLRQLQQALFKLETSGDSTQIAEQQLLALTEVALRAFGEHHAEVATALDQLRRTSTTRTHGQLPLTTGERLRYWFETTALPWWQSRKAERDIMR